ncbi:MAG: hypothetical protein ACI9MR_003464 [Myxococcota bacterium]
MLGRDSLLARAVSDSDLRGQRPRLGLTTRGRLVVGMGLTWVAAGVIFQRPVVTALGVLPLVWLIGGLAMAKFTAARLASGGAALRLTADKTLRTSVDRTLTLGVEAVLDRRVRLHALAISPVVTQHMRATILPVVVEAQPDDAQPAVIAPSPQTPDRFELTLWPQRIGDHWIHGFELSVTVVGGVFQVRTWISASRKVEALPKMFPLRADSPLRATRASLQEHSGASNRRRRGLGMEIRELRDFQPGDPFKHIAWRASARRGKLVSREFESDLIMSTHILVDVSPSMFWGAVGRSRVDYALEMAYNLASVLLARRDKTGLVVYDHAVRLRVASSTGKGHSARILGALMEAPHLVHEDRTELTDRELVERVARWFGAVQGRSFALPPGLVQSSSPRMSHYDEARLIDAAQEVLQDVTLSSAGRPRVPLDAYAADYQRSILRAFCRHVGLPLPLDPTPRPGGQAQGLEAAVQAVMTSRGGPHTIVAITDLYTADDVAALRRIAVAARRRRHTLIIFCPDDRAFDTHGGPMLDGLQHAVADVEWLRVQQSIATARAVLRPAGATFLTVGPEDALGRVLSRLRQVA